VFSTRKWQQRALLLNLVGTALLFFSFQATSSDFRLVTAKSDSALAGQQVRYALCVNNYTLIETDAKGRTGLGEYGCPSWADAKPAAVVNIEHPKFVGLGFLILVAGFLLQLLAVPEPRTIEALRQEMRVLKEQRKQVKK
jgi:hypothetical protein